MSARGPGPAGQAPSEQPLPPTALGRLCTAPGCSRAAVAKGLCLRDYKRVRAGRSVSRGEPAVGEPSGYGRYGLLDEDGDRVLCHECGQLFVSVSSHLTRGHDVTTREYRIQHGLPLGMALTASSLRARQSATSTARIEAGDAGWQRLQAARDPRAAAAARTQESLRRRGATYEQLTARNTVRAAAAPRPQRTCVVCAGPVFTLPNKRPRRTCSPACERAQQAAGGGRARKDDRNRAVLDAHDAGRSVRDIATEHAITPTRVRQILRRLRQDPQ